MVERSIKFNEQYGPVTAQGFTFEPSGYSTTVLAGDDDYLTKDTLWNFKVSKYEPLTRNTLQILMYWIMEQHSGQDIFKGINKIGIFNPRLNNAYTIDIADISSDIIKEVEEKVICY